MQIESQFHLGVIIIFKYKKCEITFDKAWQDYDDYNRTYKEVTDSYIISVLYKLKEKYDFEIINIKMRDSFGNSIKIKHKKNDKYNIFSDFCMELSGKIENVSI